MDSTLGANVVVGAADNQVSAAGAGGFTETLICVIVAMVVLRVELQRRHAGAGPGMFSFSWSTDGARRLLKECAPEAALLISCLSLAALLRSRGGQVNVVLEDEASQETWEQIISEWPLLVTADSLLSLQSMLRLVVLLSLVLRLGGSHAVPLMQEAAALSLFAGLARFALWYRTDAYLLDGPLGGNLPVACEVAVLPILLVLCRRALLRSFVLLGLAVAAVAYYVSGNRLALAPDDPTSDSLFIAAHVFDIFAAFVYLGRTLFVEGVGCDVSVGFTHLLMPLQQGLSAYFFLEAFHVTSELVGAGRPFDVLHAGSAAALGAYLAAAALFAAERFDSPRPVEV